MKKIFTSFVALVAMLFLVQSVSALTYTVTVPAGTKACYITGEMNGWSPSATPLTKVNETTYTIDLPTATETMKYQYLSGPDWKYIEKNADGSGVTDRTWSAADVVANWASVFTPDEREVTIEALVPNDVKVLYLVGSFNGWKSPSEEFKMTLDSETVDGKIFSIKVFSVDAINMEFKFVAGPAWSYEQGDPKDNFVYGTTENTKSVVVNSFKAVFDPDKTGTITITATVPAGTDSVFIQGDFLGWDMSKAMKGTKNQDGTFTFSIPMVMKIIYNLYNKADWDYVEADAAGEKFPDRSATYPEDANIAVTVVAWKKSISAVSNIKEAQNTIYSQNQMLTIENVKSDVQIFDISGRVMQSAVASGTFVSNKLNKGLYIVKVDGATRKVSVK
ncbi:MAG: T9SS type A sorting domain-containing protein [Paludibacter sp.]|jgi:hypothetical protein|nr:T9SS type A sorting domain-containing protein [Paludibacter sp.]